MKNRKIYTTLEIYKKKMLHYAKPKTVLPNM